MNPVERRVSRLEDRFAPATGQLIVVSLYDAGHKLALDHDTCVRILRDAGRIDPASAICLADFTHIPDGLSAAGLEKYFREHGTCRSAL
jgi:hypothetical protein